jgi:hypothetical protein
MLWSIEIKQAMQKFQGVQIACSYCPFAKEHQQLDLRNSELSSQFVIIVLRSVRIQPIQMQ